MGVLEAIGGFFSGLAGDVAKLAGKAWQAVKAVYLFAAGVFDKVGGAWDWMINGLGWLGNNIVGGLARLLHLLEWLALHAIPEGLSWVFREAVHVAGVALAGARHFLEGLYHTVLHWAERELASVWHWIEHEAKSIWSTLSAAWNFIERYAKRAVDLVLHPERLATWIAGAIVLPVLRWAIGNSAGVIVWVVKRAVGLLPQLAHTIEDALAQLI